MIIVNIFLGIIIHYFINKFFLKYNFLLNNPNYSDHKKLINNDNKIVLSGGVVFLVLLLFFLELNLNQKLFIFLIFLIGLISDLNKLNLPSLRLFFQFLVTFFFVYLLNLNLPSTNLKYLDLILEYKFCSILFSVFCLLVLMNGTNFLDGLNTLVIGYNILVLSSLSSIIIFFDINYDLFLILSILSILFTVLIFNFLNKSFIGDSGAYSISCLIGILCIDFYKSVENFSVLFIVVILWYPAFETLFSIIRKITGKFNPAFPDNKHLHHYLFNFIYSKVKKNLFSNILTAIIINFYNLIIFILASIYFKNSYFLLLIIFMNILIYTFSYNILKNER